VIFRYARDCRDQQAVVVMAKVTDRGTLATDAGRWVGQLTAQDFEMPVTMACQRIREFRYARRRATAVAAVPSTRRTTTSTISAAAWSPVKAVPEPAEPSVPKTDVPGP
jgi:hypothetical protein